MGDTESLNQCGQQYSLKLFLGRGLNFIYLFFWRGVSICFLFFLLLAVKKNWSAQKLFGQEFHFFFGHQNFLRGSTIFFCGGYIFFLLFFLALYTFLEGVHYFFVLLQKTTKKCVQQQQQIFIHRWQKNYHNGLIYYSYFKQIYV